MKFPNPVKLNDIRDILANKLVATFRGKLTWHKPHKGFPHIVTCKGREEDVTNEESNRYIYLFCLRFRSFYSIKYQPDTWIRSKLSFKHLQQCKLLTRLGMNNILDPPHTIICFKKILFFIKIPNQFPFFSPKKKTNLPPIFPPFHLSLFHQPPSHTTIPFFSIRKHTTKPTLSSFFCHICSPLL